MHRTIRSQRRFSDLRDDETLAANYSWVGDGLLGVYRNPSGVEPEVVVVGDRFLILCSPKQRRKILYEDIVDWRSPEKGSQPRLLLQLGDSTEVDLEIAGRDGKFWDIYDFNRFLARVVVAARTRNLLLELQERREWFEDNLGRVRRAEHVGQFVAPTEEPLDGVRYTCPCCGYPTLTERAGYEICGICFWEDDGQDDELADRALGGPNADYSLTQARMNFATHRTMYDPSDDQLARLGADRLEGGSSAVREYEQLRAGHHRDHEAIWRRILGQSGRGEGRRK